MIVFFVCKVGYYLPHLNYLYFVMQMQSSMVVANYVKY